MAIFMGNAIRNQLKKQEQQRRVLENKKAGTQKEVKSTQSQPQLKEKGK